MAFIKKIWKDRISQFPNRRTINDGYVTKQVTVGRDEGTITEQGDAFDASNMNDLEQRIEDCYGDVQALVGSEVAAQYNQDNVIFDPVATEGHGTGFVVSSDYIANLKASDLKDVNISSPTQGEALVFDEYGNLINGTVSTVGNLDDLSDVDTDGKVTGDSLRYDGAEWVAKPTTIEMTQAEYNAIVDFTPYANTHIVITDAPNLNATASDIEYSSGVTVADKIDSKANTSDLSTVATSGDYSDLLNKPTIAIAINRENSTSATFTHPNLANFSNSMNHHFLVVGFSIFAICSIRQQDSSFGQITNLGSTTVSGSKNANTLEFTLTFSTTSWTGVRVIYLD